MGSSGNVNMTGSAGGFIDNTDTATPTGGIGGSAPRGGGGGRAGAQAGSSAATAGAAFGGGGGGFYNGGSAGPGGGGGGYSLELVSAPSGTYYYTVGAAGTTGTSGGAGGAGGLVITTYATSSPTAAGNDYAEMFPVSNPGITAGDIVAVDVGVPISMKYAEKGDSALAGVIATDPGYLLGDSGAAGQRPVALAGRVPVKFSLENGPVKLGDRITPSSIPGVGMKAGIFDDTVGIVIDTPVTDAHGNTTVMIFLDLQRGIDVAMIGDALIGESASSSAALASTTATSSAPLAPSGFVTKLLGVLKTSLVAWFADVGNGIGEFFASKVRTNELCVGSTCVNESQLAALLAQAGSVSPPPASSASSSPATLILQGNNPQEWALNTPWSDNLGALFTHSSGSETVYSTSTIDTSVAGTTTIEYWALVPATSEWLTALREVVIVGEVVGTTTEE